MIIGVSGKIGSGKDTIARIIMYLTSDLRHKMSFEGYKKYTRHTMWYNKKFADKIKDITCMLIGCTREQLEDSVFKNKELGEEWWHYKPRHGYSSCTIYDAQGKLLKVIDSHEIVSYSEYHHYLKESTKFELVRLTPRKLMQLLGTDAGRNIIHPNLWVNSLMSEYKSTPVINFSENGVAVMQKYKLPDWIISDVRFPNELKAIEDREGICIRVIRPSDNHSTEEHESETALDNAIFHYTVMNDGSIDKLIGVIETILTERGII